MYLRLNKSNQLFSKNIQQIICSGGLEYYTFCK